MYFQGVKKQPLKMCCWCFLLKAGAMFIGVMGILRGSFYTVLGTEIAKEKLFRHSYALSMGISTAIIGGVFPVFGIILILAAIYEKPKLVLLTLLHSVIFFFANIVLGAIFVTIEINLNYIPNAVLSAFLILLASVWEAYSMVVLFSFYLELTQIHQSKLDLRMQKSKEMKKKPKKLVKFYDAEQKSISSNVKTSPASSIASAYQDAES